jgi:hypothetical protein
LELNLVPALGYLESVLLSQRQEARLTYSPQEDFLLSELTYSTGQLTTYLYDSLGRLDTVVLPTGKILQPLLTGKTRSQGMRSVGNTLLVLKIISRILYQ